MKIWQAVMLGIIGLIVAGCHSDPNVALLERDNNRKEVEIYHLKNRVADLEEQLNAVSPAGTVITGPGVLPGPGTLEIPSTRPAPLFTPPSGAHEEPAIPSIGPLNIMPGTETPPGEVPNTLRTPAGSEPGRGGSSQWQPHADREIDGPHSGVQLAGGAEDLDNRTIVQITLHPSLTGGIGSGSGGDQGLLVVVEPRDQAGNILPVAGPTSVALIDPALQGEQARLARWDFSAAETERMIHKGAEPGIHLRLPWRFAPAHDRLMVFVRYTNRAGLKLEAKRLISVALGDSAPARAEPPPAVVPDRLDDRPKRPQWSPDR